MPSWQVERGAHGAALGAGEVVGMVGSGEAVGMVGSGEVVGMVGSGEAVGRVGSGEVVCRVGSGEVVGMVGHEAQVMRDHTGVILGQEGTQGSWGVAGDPGHGGSRPTSPHQQQASVWRRTPAP